MPLRHSKTRASQARPSHCVIGMLAAALIPLLFILGLVALFTAGAGSMSGFPELAVIVSLIGLTTGLGRMLTHMDEHPRAR